MESSSDLPDECMCVAIGLLIEKFVEVTDAIASAWASAVSGAVAATVDRATHVAVQSSVVIVGLALLRQLPASGKFDRHRESSSYHTLLGTRCGVLVITIYGASPRATIITRHRADTVPFIRSCALGCGRCHTASSFSRYVDTEFVARHAIQTLWQVSGAFLLELSTP